MVISPEDLAVLVGIWTGRGTGIYPTIPTFDYLETVTFAKSPKPFLSYVQATKDATSDLPLHAEAGYLRIGALPTIELVIAQPSGITEAHTGVAALEGSTLRLTLASVALASTPLAKEVRRVERNITVHGDVLYYEIRMAAVAQPLQLHLRAELHRQR
jgi:hypothetical protein